MRPQYRGVWVPSPDTDLTRTGGDQPPKKLLFSLTENCRLRCDHCARSVVNCPERSTPDAIVDYVASDLVPGVSAVQLGGLDLGEQLTDPRVDGFLDRIGGNPAVNFELITNLTVMNPERARSIATVCDELYVSLEGIGERYERTRHHPWKAFARNLDMVVDARQALPGSSLRIHALVTCFAENLDFLSEILELASVGVDEFRFRRFVPVVERHNLQYLGHHITASNRVFRGILERAEHQEIVVEVPPEFRIDPLTSAAHGFDAPDESSLWPAQNDGEQCRPCHFPFETIAIRADGSVSTCCKDVYLGQLDLLRPDVEPLWMSRRWQSLRQSFAAGELWKPCRTCDWRLEEYGQTV